MNTPAAERSALRVLALARDVDVPEGRPAHEVISSWITELIVDGVLRDGERLPSERALADALGVSRMTLRQALQDLQSGGHIQRRVGSRGGSFVSSARPLVDISDLVGLSPQLLRSVRAVSSTVVLAETITTPSQDVATALRTSGDPVHLVVRVRRTDEAPVVLERSHFPADAFPDLLSHDLSGSLYALLRDHYGAEPVTAEEELSPSLPTPEECALLGLSLGQPVLRILRTGVAASGRPVEYSDDLFRSDRLRVVARGTLSAWSAAQ